MLSALSIVQQTDDGTHKISLMQGETGELWLHTNNYKTGKNSTLVRLTTIPEEWIINVRQF